MLCTIRPDNSHGCFGIKERIGTNVVSGSPFYALTPHLSYFGQKDDFTISASYFDNETRNITKSLTFDVEIGGKSKDRIVDNTTVDEGIFMDSDKAVLGLDWDNKVSNSYDLAITEPIIFSNNDSNNYTLNLYPQDVPEDWFVGFLDNDQIIKTLNISGNETKEVLLYLSLPSYIIGVQIEYTIDLDVSGDETKKGVFEKESLYATDRMMPVFYQLPDDEVVISNNLANMFSQWDELSQRNTIYFVGNSFQPDDKFSIEVQWQGEKQSSNAIFSGMLPLFIVIFVVMSLIIMAFAIRSSKKRMIASASDGTSQLGSGEDETKRAPSSRKLKEVKTALANLESDYENDKISEDIYLELKKRYNMKIIELKRKSGAMKTEDRTGLEDLEAKRMKILVSLKKLEKEYESGDLPEDLYDELKGKYKVKAIEVMKEINKIKNSQVSNSEFDEESNLAELDKKKKQILLAIKKIEREYDSGDLPENLYDELKGKYKEKAIEVMKEIDSIKTK
jgi:hypothetical protein